MDPREYLNPNTVRDVDEPKPKIVVTPIDLILAGETELDARSVARCRMGYPVRKATAIAVRRAILDLGLVEPEDLVEPEPEAKP
jgi:hypothetical protein